MLMTQRILLDGVDNFRDFGGYPVANGRRLKRGRLYRSASHGRATDGDLEIIAGLNITTIVDLRRKAERLRDPSRRHAEFAAVVIDNDLGDDVEDEWLAHLRESDLTEESFRAYLLGYYDKAPNDPRHIDLFTRYFAAIAAADGAVLIHCAAGKDRTGILTALTHHVAGVHRDDIVADYLLTNDEARFERRAPQVVELIHGVSGRAPTIAAVRVAMGVEAEFLEQGVRVNRTEFRRCRRLPGVAAGLRPTHEATLGVASSRLNVPQPRGPLWTFGDAGVERPIIGRPPFAVEVERELTAQPRGRRGRPPARRRRDRARSAGGLSPTSPASTRGTKPRSGRRHHPPPAPHRGRGPPPPVPP